MSALCVCVCACVCPRVHTPHPTRAISSGREREHVGGGVDREHERDGSTRQHRVRVCVGVAKRAREALECGARRLAGRP